MEILNDTIKKSIENINTKDYIFIWKKEFVHLKIKIDFNWFLLKKELLLSKKDINLIKKNNFQNIKNYIVLFDKIFVDNIIQFWNDFFYKWIIDWKSWYIKLWDENLAKINCNFNEVQNIKKINWEYFYIAKEWKNYWYVRYWDEKHKNELIIYEEVLNIDWWDWIYIFKWTG